MSGLYNAIFGVHPAAGFLLKLLNLTPQECGRFRDCYPSPSGDRILLYTRNGGGNRQDYQTTMDRLAKHPLYVRDYDDEVDCTYATIEFHVPPSAAEVIQTLVKEFPTAPPTERWKKLFADLDNKVESEDVKKAREVGKQIVEKILEGESGPVTPDGSVKIKKIQ